MTSAKESAFLLCSVSPETVTSEIDFTSSCQENTNSFFVCLVVFEYKFPFSRSSHGSRLLLELQPLHLCSHPQKGKRVKKGAGLLSFTFTYLFSQNVDRCSCIELQKMLDSMVFILPCENYGFCFYGKKGRKCWETSLCRRITAPM